MHTAAGERMALGANGVQTAARNYAAFVWNCCRLILRWTRRGKCFVLMAALSDWGNWVCDSFASRSEI